MTFKKYFLTTAIALFTLTPHAYAADQLHLKNGDRLTGTILSRSPARVRMQTSVGVIYIKSDMIDRVESATYTKTDLVGQRAQVIAPAPQVIVPTQAQAITPMVEPVAAAVADTPAPVETGLWGAKWSGAANIGTELETGNSDEFTINLDAKTKAKWDKHTAGIGAEYEYEEVDGVRITDDRELNSFYDYFFAEKWFWDNQLRFEQQKKQDLNLRAEYVTGLGYQFYDEDDLTLKVAFGPGYEYEDYEGEDATNSLTANWSLDYEQAFYEDFVRLFHNHDLSSPTDDFSSFLFESESGVKIPLRKNIIATGEIEFDWNNQPATGEQEDDTTYSVKLGYEW